MQETYLLKPIPLGPVSNSIQMAHTSLPCTIFPFFYSLAGNDITVSSWVT